MTLFSVAEHRRDTVGAEFRSAGRFLLFFALTAVRVYKGQGKPLHHESSWHSLLVSVDHCEESIRTFLTSIHCLVEEAMAKLR